MQTVSGEGRREADLLKELQNLKKTVALLSRRLSRQPKIPKQEPSGGIVGLVQVASTSGSLYSIAGLEVDPYSITYGAPETVSGDGSWLSVDGHELVFADEGFYLPVVQYRIGWNTAEAPSELQLYAGLSVDWMHQEPDVLALASTGAGVSGIQYAQNRGLAFVEAGGRMHAEIQWRPYTVGALQSFGGLPSVTWSIAKYA